MTASGPLAEQLLDGLRARGLTVATAESLTGGLLAAAITSVPGASSAMRGGVVAYATDVKGRLLRVPQSVLDSVGAVSAQTAASMARGARDLLAADLGIATTGVAGPDPVGDLPPGTAYVAAVLGEGPVVVQRLSMPGDRGQVQAAVVAAALRTGLDALGGADPIRE